MPLRHTATYAGDTLRFAESFVVIHAIPGDSTPCLDAPWGIPYKWTPIPGCVVVYPRANVFRPLRT